MSMIQRETTIQLTTIHTAGHPTVATMEVAMASAPETAMIYLPKELSLGMMTQTTFLVQCVVDGNCNTIVLIYTKFNVAGFRQLN